MARRMGNPKRIINAGTIRNPPPIPKNPVSNPTPHPMAEALNPQGQEKFLAHPVATSLPGWF